jgi:sterol 3beta-glucosyltransferase
MKRNTFWEDFRLSFYKDVPGNSMKIILMTFGSRGDVQPFMALALALRERGHSIMLAAPIDFETQANAYAIPFTAIPLNMKEFINKYFASDSMRNILNPITLYRLWGDAIPELSRSFYQMTVMLAELAKGTDLLISHALLLPFAYTLHQSLNIPLVLTTAVPVVRTRQFPAPMLPALPFAQGFYNPQTFGWLLRLVYSYMLAPMNQYRQEIGLSKEKIAHLLRLLWEQLPLIMHYSQHILPKPPDWGVNIHVHGVWSLSNPDTWTAPEALIKFLSEGEAPIYFGFGSMPVPNPAKTTQMISEALRLANRRGVLQAGWAGLQYEDKHLITIGDAPHDWLFPRMSALVHHGGAGTTHSAVMAGKPSLIVPFSADQPFWAQRLLELGVAVPPITPKKLKAEGLAEALRRLTQDTAMRQRAAELGALLRAEDGLTAACEFIEEYVKH